MEVTVSSGKFFELEYEVSASDIGKGVQWEFRTEEKDIGFGVFFSEDEHAVKKVRNSLSLLMGKDWIVQRKRVNSHQQLIQVSEIR